MAEAWLEEIYQESRVITRIKEAIRMLHRGDDLKGYEIWNQLAPHIWEIGGRADQLEEGAGLRLLQSAQRAAQFQRDYIAFADVLEQEILPELIHYMGLLGHIHVEEGNFEIESSQVGYLSLRSKEPDRLLHGLSDPMEDARVMVQKVYDPQKDEYCILGAGLGYLAYQLYVISEGSAHIRVYEVDREVQTYAAHYGVYDWIPEENLYVERDTDILAFLSYVAEHENVGCIISEWIRGMIPEAERPAIEQVYAYCYAVQTIVETCFAINFWKNQVAATKMVTELPKGTLGEDFLVVAAGPSLDRSMEFLQKNRERFAVIAVGTVFRKLISRRITPDYVAILDSHELVYEQLRGLEDQKVPLIMPQCAYWKIAETYQGDIYQYPSADCVESSIYAREHNIELWGSGGTVAYTALRSAVELGAKNIYLLGLDLAYPDKMSHAEGTSERKEMPIENLCLVEKVGGGEVYSDFVFSLYREMVEDFVAICKEVTFYNLSKEGARIKGTIEIDCEKIYEE